MESIAHFLDSVRAVVKDRDGWEVVDDIFLANFSYSKLAMVRDLDVIKEHGTDNPIVLALGGLSSDEVEPGESNPMLEALEGDLSGGRMDDVLETKQPLDGSVVYPTFR